MADEKTMTAETQKKGISFMRLFKNEFWFWLARRMPQALRYHVVIMCTADYSVAFPTTEAPSTKAMVVAKWLERENF